MDRFSPQAYVLVGKGRDNKELRALDAGLPESEV